MNMQITEVRIYPTNEDLVKAYVTITHRGSNISVRKLKSLSSRQYV